MAQRASCNIKALKACEKTTRYNGKTYTLYDFRDCSFKDRSLYSQASRMYYQPDTPAELIQMINERVDREVHYKIADRY
ncbi:hypothetical protein KHM83_09310 [Fusibacter paucivorans]|uniref:KTSC domain-containing protein n=1 Tax=Fusibacter paucivorans TaxID=76009 RepID=A0ABS5PNW8_9FIRM|nr:hypothetical protein [Fusibacter paucivorans]MBS7526874.1 hypothetical protein [Fusibacter paucivorans]